MTWDPTPWLIGGGAQHSPEVARLLAYAATSSAEGIVGVGDLRVSALSVPGASVNVAPGAALIRDRSAGGDQQTYVARLISQDTVGIAATDSSGGRSDLIVARVEDPFSPGETWDEPADPTTGQYVYTRVIPNVPPTTETVEELGLGYSAIPLARVDIPASTATIQDNMVTDLREVAQPRTKRWVRAFAPSGDYLTQGSFTVWPGQSGWELKVPEWATRAVIVATWAGIKVADGNAWGGLRVILGSTTTPGTGYNIDAGNQTDRFTAVATADIHIPQSDRGTYVTLDLQGYKNNGSSGSVQADSYASVSIDVDFREEAA